MKEKLPDFVLKQCKVNHRGHIVIVRLIKCGKTPFYTAYYSVDKKFKGKSKDWIDYYFPTVHGGYSLPPSTLVGCDPKLTFVGWDYYHNGDVTEDYSIELIKQHAIGCLDEYINKFEAGER